MKTFKGKSGGWVSVDYLHLQRSAFLCSLVDFVLAGGMGIGNTISRYPIDGVRR